MTKTEIKDEVKDQVGDTYHIVVHNDDVNAFQYVILVFMAVLGHTMEQAEQLAQNIHNTGKASVKQGDYVELEPLCTALLEKNISAEIQMR